MVLFEWDEAKAESNRQKHGITFGYATQIFDDPFILAEPERVEDGKERWQSIGLVECVAIVLVAHTIREEAMLRWFASSRHDGRRGRSADDMGRIIRRTADECRLTEQDKQRLAALAERPDSEIDFSDIPPLTEEFWQNAVPNPFFKPVKKQVTLRIDADVLAWLRRQGQEGYQSRLNGVLRQAMLEDLKAKRKRA